MSYMKNVKNRIDLSEYDLKEGLAAGSLFFVITGLVTELIPNPFYERMVPVTFVDYIFLFSTSLLATVYFGKKQCSVRENRLAGIGGIAGFLAFGCPTCNIFLIAFLSSSAIMTYVDPVRPYFGIISTAVMLFLVLKDRIDLENLEK